MKCKLSEVIAKAELMNVQNIKAEDDSLKLTFENTDITEWFYDWCADRGWGVVLYAKHSIMKIWI